MVGSPHEILGESITKLLSDKLYDNRKKAAIEVEQMIRRCLADQAPGGRAQVQRIIDCLKSNFVESSHANHRKGGLIAMAAVAIALDTEGVRPYLPQLLIPALQLFDDKDDSRVRYYSCEAVYNIAKVAKEGVLAHFHEIFDGLCTHYVDVDDDVKNGVQTLDRELRDIVTLHPEHLCVADFIPQLAQLTGKANPHIRQVVLAWITVLLKLPQVDMVRYLPQYLEGLFNMLADQNQLRDIKNSAEACLNRLLKEVRSSPQDKAFQIISDTASIVVNCCFSNDACSRLTALSWLREFVHLQMRMTSQVSGRPVKSWVELLPDLLKVTLHCIDDPEDQIARMAVEMNNEFLEMVQQLDDIPVHDLEKQLYTSMQSKSSPVVRVACLQWIHMLLQGSPAQMLQRPTLNRLFGPIFDTLLHPNDEIIVAALRVLAQIMEGSCNEQEQQEQQEQQEEQKQHDSKGPPCVAVESKDLFTVVTHRLLKMFASSRNMLETRGRLMIRQLCGYLDPRRLYVTVARAIRHEADLQFAQHLVQTFGWILLTAEETKGLRDELLTTAPLVQISDKGQDPNCTQDSARLPLFLELIEPWFHNPVSALSLCLWAQQYELATELTARLAAFEPTLDLLTQLDQLVHLIESPVFSRLRLRLLEPRRHPALLKCLLGLAMLLPQAEAFHILRKRIHVVQSGLLLEASDQNPRDVAARVEGQGMPFFSWAKSDGAQESGTSTTGTDIASLLKRFDAVTHTALC